MEEIVKFIVNDQMIKLLNVEKGCVNFIIESTCEVEDEIVPMSDIDSSADVILGHFGYDMCIHFRCPYLHICNTDVLADIKSLLDLAHNYLLSNKLDNFTIVI